MQCPRLAGIVPVMDTHRRYIGQFVGALALVVSSVWSGTMSAAVFAVTEPWVRVAPNGRSAEAYMQLLSSDGATFVGARSVVVDKIDLRPPVDGKAAAGEMSLPAGVTVALAPGAWRLVLPALKRPLKLGDRVPLVLTIKAPDGGTQEIAVDAEVRRRSPTDDHLRPHSH